MSAHLGHPVQDNLGGAQELAHVVIVLEHLELVPVKEPGGALREEQKSRTFRGAQRMMKSSSIDRRARVAIHSAFLRPLCLLGPGGSLELSLLFSVSGQSIPSLAIESLIRGS
jgi:hypothetical protein